MSLFEDDEGGLILGDEDGDALLGEEEEQEEQAEEEEEEEEEDQALAVEDGAGDGGVSPRKAGLEPSSEVVAGDPHVEGFAECSKELVNAYMELENSVVAIIRSQDDHDLGKFEQDCYANLEKLNARCDRLRRLTERKKDIIAVEQVLLKRGDRDMQDPPQDYVQVKAEELFVSRSEFQKVLLG